MLGAPFARPPSLVWRRYLDALQFLKLRQRTELERRERRTGTLELHYREAGDAPEVAEIDRQHREPQRQCRGSDQ